MVRFCPFLIAALAVVCEDARATEAANPSLEKEVSTYLAENPAPAAADNTSCTSFPNTSKV